MTSITRAVLRHRRLVVVTWIAVAVVGALTVTSATSRLSHGFSTPGNPGYEANRAIQSRFGIDGHEQPAMAVLTLPPGETMHAAAGQATAARVFGAIPKAGHLAVADYANTHDPRFRSQDARTTW